MRIVIPLALAVLAVGLAMDATAVAMTTGFSAERVRVRDALVLAATFGVFQGVMPMIGWVVGDHFADEISSWDHWVAFVLLGAIGVKMVVDGAKLGREPHKSSSSSPFRIQVLLLLALATSIDALAAGITLPFLNVRLLTAAIVIGATTFVLSLVGVKLGRVFGDRFGGSLDVFGGLVLIGIGTKTLIEHLAAS